MGGTALPRESQANVAGGSAGDAEAGPAGTWRRLSRMNRLQMTDVGGGSEVPASTAAVETVDAAEAAARRALRAQIARLEGELAAAFVTAFPMGGLPHPEAGRAQPRLLDLGELERVRDELAHRLRAARVTIAQRADEQAQKRVALEQMLLHPEEHRFERISCRELGQPGCGVWQVRPRLGLLGMLMGWWQVKLSSGCPLARGHGAGAALTVTRSASRDPARPRAPGAALTRP